MDLVSGPIKTKDNTPREMTAKELLFLLKEAEGCFWKGYEAASQVGIRNTTTENILLRNEQHKWESKGKEVKEKINAEGFDVDCTNDGCFWFLSEKEVTVDAN